MILKYTFLNFSYKISKKLLSLSTMSLHQQTTCVWKLEWYCIWLKIVHEPRLAENSRRPQCIDLHFTVLIRWANIQCGVGVGIFSIRRGGCRAWGGSSSGACSSTARDAPAQHSCPTLRRPLYILHSPSSEGYYN